MANKLTIWNRALTKVGERRVTSLTEDSPNGRKLRENYEEDKLAVLAMHSWKFARKQQDLALNVTAPLEGYENSFELPNDFVRIVALNDTYPEDRDTPFFVIREDKLHTDESVAKIEYIYNVDQEGLFAPLFVEALSSYIAWNLSYSIQKANSEALERRFQMDLGKAKSADGAADRTAKPSLYAWQNLKARLGGYPV